MNTLRLAKLLRLPILDRLDDHRADDDYLRRFPISFSREHRILAVRSVEDPISSPLQIAIADDAGWRHLDHVRRWLDCEARPVFVQSDALLSMINAAYSDRDTKAEQVLESMDAASLASRLEALGTHEDLLDDGARAPVIRLVNQMIFDAVIAGASDIHVQPSESAVTVRQRVDGVLFDVFQIPKAIQEEVLTRIKVMGKMNIAEKRLPQDGRASVQLGDRRVDLRIASLPTSHNERMVIRLLDKSLRLYTLEELGMDSATLQRWRSLIRVDHGLILVTGPTGSGKSTTLYGALQEVHSAETNILTLEDPIEYQLEGISQTQINEKKGMTFASGMRSVLRQDPDIIMIGEIRDPDTANMAIQASLTGHLVFSTLHTNDAAGAVTRLLDLGVEPYLVASSLVASLAQRLVRRVCVQCQDTDGCRHCRHTGFSGRVGLFELLVINDRIRSLVQSREDASAIREAAIQRGMALLSEDGRKKATAGITTMDEVRRVTMTPHEHAS